MNTQNQREMKRMADYVEAATTAYFLAAVTETVDALHRRMPVDTAHARSAVTAALGGLAPGFPEVSQAQHHTTPSADDVVREGTGGFQLGDTVGVGNRAGHFPVIAPGRYMGSDGKMKGSEQHPDPIVPAAIQDARAAMAGWTYRGRA